MLLVLLMFFSTGRLAFSNERLSASKATVVEYEGILKLKRSTSKQWVSAVRGVEVEPGDHLKTGEDSYCLIMLQDTSTIKLGEDTHLEITHLQDNYNTANNRFKLFVGKVWSQVNKNLNKKTDFQVEAPHTLAAVRGTAFELRAESDSTEILVYDGAVDCTAGEMKERIDSDIACRFGKRGVIGNVSRIRREKLDDWQKWNLQVDDEMQSLRRDKLLKPGKITMAQRVYIINRLKKLPRPIRKKVQRNLREQYLRNLREKNRTHKPQSEEK